MFFFDVKTSLFTMLHTTLSSTLGYIIHCQAHHFFGKINVNILYII
jgi:hypothetical protein